MGSATTSPSLLSRVRDPADQAAWREFDARYGDLIVRYCRARGIQHTDAEDIRQMVMVKLSRALAGFRYSRRRGRFRTYLGRVTHNEMIRHLTRPSTASRRVNRGAREQAAADAADPEAEAQWEREWMHHHLRLALRRLRETGEPRRLEVFERLVAGETVEQVARAFGMTTQAVHKIKQRMRDRLKEMVAAQVRDEDEADEDPRRS
ncbi:MAG: RNA polymerase sigma factor [Planctomycetota bacterium]